jgi:hypothetical protein
MPSTKPKVGVDICPAEAASGLHAVMPVGRDPLTIDGILIDKNAPDLGRVSHEIPDSFLVPSEALRVERRLVERLDWNHRHHEYPSVERCPPSQARRIEEVAARMQRILALRVCVTNNLAGHSSAA